MRLWQALGVSDGEVVALTGAGGKTTTLYLLAHELLAQGQRVIVATTTHMWPPAPAEGWPLIVTEDSDERLAAAERAISDRGRAFVAAGYTPEGKLRGIPLHEVAPLRRLAATILIEADGARGRPLKAPAEHEPAVPAQATLVVPVVGLSAIGAQISPETIHRPERLSDLMGLQAGSAISCETVADLLVAAQGGLRGVPTTARVVPLCNQADDSVRRDMGRQVARSVLRADSRIRRLVVGAVQEAPQECECWRPAVVVVLAAGAARRYGRLKQAEKLAGQPLLRRVVEAALSSLASQVLVVLGCQAEQLWPVLAQIDHPRLAVVSNPLWEEGVASSIRAALTALGGEIEATVFAQADQPFLSSREIDALLIRHAQTGAPIVAPRLGREIRSPVLFSRRLFPELAGLAGDVGGRQLIAQHSPEVEFVEVVNPLPYADVDTPADLLRLRSLAQPGRAEGPQT